ncbi:purine nucleoside phosphorylase-like [Glandiceps talaboti]
MRTLHDTGVFSMGLAKYLSTFRIDEQTEKVQAMTQKTEVEESGTQMPNAYLSLSSELMGYTYEDITLMTKCVERQTRHRPKIGIIVASGLNKVASIVDSPDKVVCSELPNFPSNNNEECCLLFGTLHGIPVVSCQSNLRQIDGYPAWQVGLVVRIMSFIGVKTLMVCNTGQKLNTAYNIGDLVLVKDHINLPSFAGDNPLVGLKDHRFGSIFLNMANAYDKKLRRLALSIGSELNYGSYLREGIYVQQAGPSFESTTALNHLRAIDADMFGMDMLPEVTIARHSGMDVCLVTMVMECKNNDTRNGLHNIQDVDDELLDRRTEDIITLISCMVNQIE